MVRWQQFFGSVGSRRWVGLGAALIVLAGVLAYARGFTTPFVFDDLPGVVENTSIRDLSNWRAVLWPPASGAGVDSRPLVNLSLALNYAGGGLRPWGYHVTNLAIHLGAALLLFGVVRRTLAMAPEIRPEWRDRAGAVGLAVALLWTVHPLQSETVIGVIQRTEAWVSLWYLAVLYALVRGVTAGTVRRRHAWQVAGVSAGLLGMASKEVMVTAPLVALLFDRSCWAGSWREVWRERRGFYLGLAATWGLLLWLVLQSGGDRGGTSGYATGISGWTYLLTQARAIGTYLRLAVWPHPLVVDYGTWLAPGLGAVAGEFVVLSLLVVGAVVAWWRKPVTGILAVAFFLILAPSSSIYPLASQTIAEHRMHLALAPLLVLGILAGWRWAQRMMPLAVAVLAVAGIAVTALRCGDYASELTLWNDVVAKVPGNPWGHFNRGKALARTGDWAGTVAADRTAVTLSPDNADFRYALAFALERTGARAEALAAYGEAIRLRPRFAPALERIGVLLLGQRRLAEARGCFERAWAIDPTLADTAGNLGALAYQAGDQATAAMWFERVLALRPGSVDAHYNLGLVRAELGQGAAAIAELETAARLAPQNAEIAAQLHRVRAQVGRSTDGP